MERDSQRVSAKAEDERLKFEPADVYQIDDLKGFELLSDATRIEVLELLREPHSVKEIAAAMDVPRTRLYHHVGMLEEAGMLAVVDERQAGALTEKIYQVAAKNFRPSEEFSKNANKRELAEAILTSVMSTTRADFLRALEDGRFSMEKDTSAKQLAIGRRLMRLTPDHLENLVDDLEAVLEKYSDLADSKDAVPVAVLHIVHPSSRQIDAGSTKTVVT